MGLDMYLVGDKFLRGEKQEEDGYPVDTKLLDLGYWRKHPNLHGYIVNTFANGEDKCQKIELDADDLREIVKAVKEGDLPETTGFFFGESEDSARQRAVDTDIIERAISWLEAKDEGSWRSVYYQASW
jgi:hypothetical protein